MRAEHLPRFLSFIPHAYAPQHFVFEDDARDFDILFFTLLFREQVETFQVIFTFLLSPES